MLVAVLAIGRLLLPRAPRLSAWGTALGVLGCFGHAVFGGIALTYLVMARDEARREEYAALMDAILDSPVMVVAMVGLVGFVLGLLLLGIGLFRARVGAALGRAGDLGVPAAGVRRQQPQRLRVLPRACCCSAAAFLALAQEIRAASHVDGGVEPVGEPLRDLGQRA